jgi:hypothetical protein
MPAYQKAAVKGWRGTVKDALAKHRSWKHGFKKHLPSSKYGAEEQAYEGGAGAGRAYPDISVLGLDYAVVHNGETMGISGTSCGTPVRMPFSC